MDKKKKQQIQSDNSRKMFATLKNKIKEETGEDVSTSRQSTNNNNNNINNYRLRSRRVSINSNFADDVGGGGSGGIYIEVK